MLRRPGAAKKKPSNREVGLVALRLLILGFSLNLRLRRWVCGKAAGGGQAGGRASFCPSTGLSTPLSRVRPARADFHISTERTVAAWMPQKSVRQGWRTHPYGDLQFFGKRQTVALRAVSCQKAKENARRLPAGPGGKAKARPDPAGSSLLAVPGCQ